jgi:two-component system response regulator
MVDDWLTGQGGAKMKPDILLVEDNSDDAALALRVLKQDNPRTKVKIVRDGVELLEYLFDKSEAVNSKLLPKVIFLDIKLPRLTGPEALKRIRNNDDTRNIPVVIMTSSNQQRDVAECYQLGANSYLVKPIDFSSYYSMIVNCSRYWLNYNVSTPV